MTDLEDKMLSFLSVEGEGNYDLSSQLPQSMFVFWSAGNKNLPGFPSSHSLPHIHMHTGEIPLFFQNCERDKE